MRATWEAIAKGYSYPVKGVGVGAPPFAKGWRAIDGDTVEARIDKGWDGYQIIHVRPPDLDVPESWTEAGKVITQAVICWLESCDHLWVVSYEIDGRGRTIGDIFDDNLNLYSEFLIEHGFCKQYDGRKKRPGFTQDELDRIERLGREYLEASGGKAYHE